MNQRKDKPKTPFGLIVTGIFSIIGSALMVFLSIALFGYAFVTQEIEFLPSIFMIFAGVILHLVKISGVIVMLTMRKAGYYLYLIGEILFMILWVWQFVRFYQYLGVHDGPRSYSDSGIEGTVFDFIYLIYVGGTILKVSGSVIYILVFSLMLKKMR